jgi:hypothetical protein
MTPAFHRSVMPSMVNRANLKVHRDFTAKT